MKLRIRGSAIRLRLTKPEVLLLGERGLVEDAASFPGGGRLRYAIELSELPKLTASFDRAGIVVKIPSERGRAWCSSEEVGIEGADGETRLLIEKDFACVQPRSDEDPDEMFTRSAPE